MYVGVGVSVRVYVYKSNYFHLVVAPGIRAARGKVVYGIYNHSCIWDIRLKLYMGCTIKDVYGIYN